MSDTKFDATQMDEVVREIKKAFINRVLFIGLIGSNARKEASIHNEADIILILDKLYTDDILNYKKFIASSNFSLAINGIIFGKNEFINWSKLELFCMLYETKPLFGNLEFLVTKPNKQEIKQAIKLQAGNIYFNLTKSLMNYSQMMEVKHKIINLYKQAFFILQMKYFLEKDIYIETKAQLMENLKGLDRIILNHCINKENIITKNSEEVLSLCEILLKWTSDVICQTSINVDQMSSLDFYKGKTLTYEKVKEILRLE